MHTLWPFDMLPVNVQNRFDISKTQAKKWHSRWNEIRWLLFIWRGNRKSGVANPASATYLKRNLTWSLWRKLSFKNSLNRSARSGWTEQNRWFACSIVGSFPTLCFPTNAKGGIHSIRMMDKKNFEMSSFKCRKANKKYWDFSINFFFWNPDISICAPGGIKKNVCI